MEAQKPEKVRLKTKTIVLGAAMSALILSGCSDKAHKRRCVDSMTGTVQESYYCEDDETTRRYHGVHFSSYGWYWGGVGYSRGDSVRDGSTTPPRGYAAPGFRTSGGSVAHSVSSAHGVTGGTSRGGFGASAAVHGGGGS